MKSISLLSVYGGAGLRIGLERNCHFTGSRVNIAPELFTVRRRGVNFLGTEPFHGDGALP